MIRIEYLARFSPSIGGEFTESTWIEPLESGESEWVSRYIEWKRAARIFCS